VQNTQPGVTASDKISPDVGDGTRETLKRAEDGQLASMHIGCPGCGRTYLLPLEEMAPSGPRPTELPEIFECDDCHLRVPLHARSLDAHQQLGECALCGTNEFFIQKDFNRRLGLFVVIISALVAFLVMVRYGHLYGFPVFLGVTLIDWWIYQRMRNVAVCYLCHTIYRGVPLNPDHKGFYLGSEERFKKPRQEWIKGLRE